MERDPAPALLLDRADDTADHLVEDEDVVVLSWWQHPVNVVALAVTAALLAGLVGWLLASAAAEPESSDLDVGFLQDMRVHHEQALQMGLIYLDLADTDPGLQTDARSIVVSQGIDIGRMIQLLRERAAPEAAEGEEAMAWMGMPTTHSEMPGMSTEDELDALAASSGTGADERFVELMIAHHRGGVEMAEYAAERAASGDVRDMAAAMARNQATEIVELEGLAG